MVELIEQAQRLIPIWIYALVDPQSNMVRYVGRSTDPQRRYNQHLHRQDANPHLWNWIRSLLVIGKKPLMVILEQTNECDWADREAFFIHHFLENGDPLVNVESGGGSNYIITQEAKERMRISQLNRDVEVNSRISRTLIEYYKNNPGYWAGKTMPDEARNNMRLAKFKKPTRYWQGKTRSQEDREKMSLSRRRYFDRIGRKKDAVVNELLSDRSLLNLSNRDIAKRLGVDHRVVGDAREIITGSRTRLG